MTSDLRVCDLSMDFGGVHALSDVSIAFPPSKIIGIIGPNGAGKTTLLNAVCGLLPISRGSITLDGRELVGLRPDEVAVAGVRRTFRATCVWPSPHRQRVEETGAHGLTCRRSLRMPAP